MADYSLKWWRGLFLESLEEGIELDSRIPADFLLDLVVDQYFLPRPCLCWFRLQQILVPPLGTQQPWTLQSGWVYSPSLFSEDLTVDTPEPSGFPTWTRTWWATWIRCPCGRRQICRCLEASERSCCWDGRRGGWVWANQPLCPREPCSSAHASPRWRTGVKTLLTSALDSSPAREGDCRKIIILMEKNILKWQYLHLKLLIYCYTDVNAPHLIVFMFLSWMFFSNSSINVFLSISAPSTSCRTEHLYILSCNNLVNVQSPRRDRLSKVIHCRFQTAHDSLMTL